jgi:hypothetical protein
MRIRFCYSDRVAAFLNGRPIYRGIAQFASRDARFLGAIGLSDELDLPLHAGDDEALRRERGLRRSGIMEAVVGDRRRRVKTLLIRSAL